MLKNQCLKYVAVIMTCFFMACSQSPSSSEKNTGQISGQILTEGLIIDVQDFQVRAYKHRLNQWQDEQPVNVTSVASDGSFLLNLPEGDYIVTLFMEKQNGPELFYNGINSEACSNYEAQLVDVENGEIISTKKFICDPESLKLSTGGTISNIDFDIRETGHVIGLITNSENTPLTQVTVQAVYEEKIIAQTQTNEKGEYTICSLPDGDYHIVADPENDQYITQYFSNAYYSFNADIISVISGTGRNDADFQLTKGGTITGKIIDADSLNPIENILVSAIDNANNVVTGKSLASDADGNYTICGLPPGRYILHADASNSSYVSCYFKSAYTINSANAINIYGAEILTEKDFDLQLPGRLIAKVVEKETGNLIDNDNIYVKIYRASDHELVQTVQSIEGFIDAKGLREDKYKFEIITAGTRYAPVFYSDKTTLESAWPIQIFNGKTRDDLLFELKTGGQISGRVVESQNGTVLFEYNVCATSQINPRWVHHVTTNVDGEYVLKGLIEGPYIVEVFTDEESLYVPEYYQNIYARKDATLIDVTYDQTDPDINFSLDQGGKIYGLVTSYETGEPVPGITLYALNGKGLTYSAQTLSDGTYSIFGIPNGNNYSIYADTTGTSYISEYYSFGGSEIPISFDFVGQAKQVDFSLAKKSKICGTFTCPSNHQMNYCMEDLVPGTYILNVHDEENVLLKTSEEINLSPNQEIIDMDFNF
ncbi:conserved hypothetical protein, secreted [Candidatus Magnetomorum sp. HK-1]|nr:conserved hypothetical protein, secreted [Candidatus Magnetomorum sp. HK-1]